jgi:hypothetical protein
MKRFRYPMAMVAVLMLGVTTTFAAGILSLPPDPVAATHGPWNHGSNSTLDITLKLVPEGFPHGYHVTNGAYAGWCLEDNHRSDAPPGSTVTLLDSADKDPLNCDPGGFPDVPWEEVNYLLNHQQGAMGDIPATIEDIQAALWIVAGTDNPGGGTFPVTPEVTALVIDAQLYGPGFLPAAGNVVAVILFSDGLGPDGYQDTIIEVPLSYGCTPGFWKQKHYFDRWADPLDTTFFGVFEVTPTNGNLPLAKALKMGGSGENALMRHGSAAYLNAICQNVDYFFTAKEVIAIVKDAYATGDFEAARKRLEMENERGCPCSVRRAVARRVVPGRGVLLPDR